MKTVEATIVLPATVIIIVCMIGIMMTMYNELGRQIEEHDKIRTEMYEKETNM